MGLAIYQKSVKQLPKKIDQQCQSDAEQDTNNPV